MPKPRRTVPKRNVAPDRLDLRDRPYLPAIVIAPTAEMRPKLKLPVLDQGDTNAIVAIHAKLITIGWKFNATLDARFFPDFGPGMS